jgi:hypothetical protein
MQGYRGVECNRDLRLMLVAIGLVKPESTAWNAESTAFEKLQQQIARQRLTLLLQFSALRGITRKD